VRQYKRSVWHGSIELSFMEDALEYIEKADEYRLMQARPALHLRERRCTDARFEMP
jgi:ATP-dependent protease Clp ATPase subunit